jgi:hypothetical protein
MERLQLTLPHVYRREAGEQLDGLKVWPENSPLVQLARATWDDYKKKNLPGGEAK